MLNLSSWQHPNTLTWERKNRRKVAARVEIHYDGSAYATVFDASGKGQPREVAKRDFGEVEAAKTWCDEMLSPKSKPSPTPDAVERLVHFLQENPDIAWLVANRVKVLSPWDDEHWCERADVTSAYLVRVLRDYPDGWSFRINDDEPVGGFATREAAMAQCDQVLITDGWVLATRPLGETS